MLKYLSHLFVILLLTLSGAYANGSLALEGSERWYVMESHKSADKAVYEALRYTYSGYPVHVLKARNGFHAVVLGPMGQKDIADMKKDRAWLLPEDAYLSKGKGFVSKEWSSPALETIDLDKPEGYWVNLEGLEVHARLQNTKGELPNPDDYEDTSIVVTGKSNGQDLFTIQTDASAYSSFGQIVEVIRLSPATRFPQVVVKRFTGGAHCCIENSIITQDASGAWAVVDGAVLDGGYGYSYADLNRDGAVELYNRDNTFLYLFAPYAGSFAPTEISTLKGTELENVSADSSFKGFFRHELEGMEELAKENKELWNENGYLAAWAANKARVGEAGDAFARIMPLYNPNSDFGILMCAQTNDTFGCGDNDASLLPFPVALPLHLKEQGYLEPIRD
ncbi:hypothetical protein E1162_08365 [Rhodobacteraceae bacterium RKSG542]|uniref:hypothetical protein n=1 Tax=Pseudovibrio flavus TaxID=2529854 RepID=UPI0012BC4A53|nr:hypothetical protein [Pseudovibrio flavus]MTI17255.1 hypothetical protein [Pseudovibrio flavus]